MPPRVRVPLSSSLRALNEAAGHGSPSVQICRSFASTSIDQASTVQQKRRHRDPYAIAQARARKAANISRQELLEQERAAALGDPVRGRTTPFVQSFDSAIPPPPTSSRTSDAHSATRDAAKTPNQPPQSSKATDQSYLNFFLSKTEVDEALQRSKPLVDEIPSVFSQEANDTELDRQQTEKDHKELEQKNAEKHATAAEALNRIVSLTNASSKDRLRVNIQRCIDAFGRHKTDEQLSPRPPVAESISAKNPMANAQKTERAGPDTGSSEVQIAILTAKIRTLADFLESRGRPDKINKRNLTILVHKRQKLLKYLREKERGGPRWQNLIETLGLTEGTWKGEISLR